MADSAPARPPEVPFVEFVLDVIRSNEGDEPLALHPKGAAVIGAAVRVLLASKEEAAQKKAKLRSALAVAYVLENEKKSPTAARALVEALTENVKVAQLLGIETKALRDRGKALKKFLGDDELKRAPKLNEAAPMGSLKLSSFLDPGKDAQAAARARNKGPKVNAPSSKPKPKAPQRRRGVIPPNKKG